MHLELECYRLVAGCLKRSPRERKVMGLIPRNDRPKSLKLVVVDFPLGAQDYKNNTTTDLPMSG